MKNFSRPSLSEGTPRVVRRLSPSDLVLGAVVETVTHLAFPLKQQLIRWRRSGAYLAVLLLTAGMVVAALPPGVSTWWALLVAPSLFFISMAAAIAVVILKEPDVWFVRDGLRASLVLGGWTKAVPTPDRGYWLHSWAAWPRRHGLGRIVATAALAETPRPLWLLPATPELRELYAQAGAVPHGARWMVIK